MNILNFIVIIACCTMVIIFIVLIIRLYNYTNNTVDQEMNQEVNQEVNQEMVEGYYDITPYEAHWDIFKCYDPKCIKDKSYKCYKWCSNIANSGASQNCQTRCSDYADMQFHYLKFNDYTWDGAFGLLNDATLLKSKNQDYEVL